MSDFDVWFDEHKGNAEKLEQHKQQQLAAILSTCSPERQQQLLQLQWRIDGEIAKARTPMKSAIVLSKMMMESFYKLNGALRNLHDTMTQPAPQSNKPSLRLIENKRDEV